MKLSGMFAIIGALILLLVIIFGGDWFFTEEPAVEVPASTFTVSNDRMATLSVPSDSGVSAAALSPWQVIEFDALEQTYLGGYEISGPSDAFVVPFEFEMSLNNVPNGVPVVFREVSGITLPVEDVTYVMVNGVIDRIRTRIDAPGRIYLLQQHVFYGERPFLSLVIDSIDETVVGETLETELNMSYRDDIAVYGVVAGQEYGYGIDGVSVRVSVDARASGSAVSPLAASDVARLQAPDETSVVLPVDTTLTCVSTDVAPIEITARVSFSADRFVRRVDDWVAHYNSQSTWSLVENSTDDHSYTFVSIQSPRCI